MTITIRLTYASASICAVLLSASAAWAQTQPIELKVSIFAPATNPMAVATEAWGEILKQKSNGRLTLKIFAASQMGPPPRQFDLVRTGVADVAVVPHFVTPGRFPLTDLTYLPGVITTTSYPASLALSQIAQETLGAEHPGVKILAVGVITPTVFISKLPIKGPADLKGKRIRSSGAVNAELLTALGAVPTSIQPGEMNDALGKGMIDAASTAYSGIASYQLVDVAKFLSEGPFGATTFATVMSQATYDKLPADLKAIIDETRTTAAQLLGKALADDEVKYRAASIAKGATVTPFADDGSLAKASETLRDKAIADATAKGLDAKGFLEKFKAALAQHKDAK
jgi:TRAP-type transport system periplasmic protein